MSRKLKLYLSQAISAGDAYTQYAHQQGREFDLRRSLVHFSFGAGFVVFMVANHRSRDLVDMLGIAISSGLLLCVEYGPFLRMIADQLLFVPIGLGVYFIITTELKEKSSNENTGRYKDALLANYAVWPWIQLINFSFVPLPLRMPFIGLASIGWNAYLSNLRFK